MAETLKHRCRHGSNTYWNSHRESLLTNTVLQNNFALFSGIAEAQNPDLLEGIVGVTDCHEYLPPALNESERDTLFAFPDSGEGREDKLEDWESGEELTILLPEMGKYRDQFQQYKRRWNVVSLPSTRMDFHPYYTATELPGLLPT